MKKSTKLSLTMLIAALPICLTACEKYEGSSFSNLGVSYTDFEVVSHESSLILSTYNQYKHVVEIKNTGEDYALFSHPSVIFDFPGGTSRTVTSFETFICNTDESVILAPNQTTTISFITTGFDNFTGFKLTTEAFKGKPVDYVKASTPVYVDKDEKVYPDNYLGNVLYYSVNYEYNNKMFNDQNNYYSIITYKIGDVSVSTINQDLSNTLSLETYWHNGKVGPNDVEITSIDFFLKESTLKEKMTIAKAPAVICGFFAALFLFALVPFVTYLIKAPKKLAKKENNK